MFYHSPLHLAGGCFLKERAYGESMDDVLFVNLFHKRTEAGGMHGRGRACTNTQLLASFYTDAAQTSSRQILSHDTS